MEVLVLHILKLNIIAAIVILLVKVLATLFKGRVYEMEVLYLAVDYDKPLCSGAPSGESGTGGFQST